MHRNLGVRRYGFVAVVLALRRASPAQKMPRGVYIVLAYLLYIQTALCAKPVHQDNVHINSLTIQESFGLLGTPGLTAPRFGNRAQTRATTRFPSTFVKAS